VPGKLDPKKQAAFITECEKLRKNADKSEPVCFGDAMRCILNSTAGRNTVTSCSLLTENFHRYQKN
jgi:hypothetical protein